MKVKDPVCHREINEVETAFGGLTTIYQHQVFFFCSVDCKQQFSDNPLEHTRNTIQPENDIELLNEERFEYN